MAASLHRNPFNRIHNVSITARLRTVFASILLIVNFTAAAQTDSTPVFKNATAANRSKTYSNIVKNTITKNLSLPLTDSTEENWQDAFYAMEVLQYKQPWVQQKVKTAFISIEKKSASFQRALMEVVYTNYKTEFTTEVNKLMLSTKNAKVFAMCAEYLVKVNTSKTNADKIGSVIYNKKINEFENNVVAPYIIYELLWPIIQQAEKENYKTVLKLNEILNSNFVRGNIIIYSIQRKNRNYPGVAIVRDSTGKFITDSSGNIFSVPQLARSITNLPGYLTNGNTPQGIFRMNGFAVSKSDAIGPTENIQLLMPYETSPKYFLKDSNITDTIWTKELYERLLPIALKKYHPLFGAFYASAIGRTEIIAHGTTVDPSYYNGATYYPHTPTQGCLCTKEIWSAANGKRTISDQQKLVDAVKKAGGANGYLIVIEIDDKQQAVTLQDVLPFLSKSK
jgi:hypothetical protein